MGSGTEAAPKIPAGAHRATFFQLGTVPHPQPLQGDTRTQGHWGQQVQVTLGTQGGSLLPWGIPAGASPSPLSESLFLFLFTRKKKKALESKYGKTMSSHFNSLTSVLLNSPRCSTGNLPRCCSFSFHPRPRDKSLWDQGRAGWLRPWQ